MALEVVATWRGGMATDVQARGHTIRVDEPTTSGGDDSGMMPTELFCAALASCFCLAVGFAAGKRDQEVPGLKVTVTAERRRDASCATTHLVVTTAGRARARARWPGWSSGRARCAGSPTAWRAG